MRVTYEVRYWQVRPGVDPNIESCDLDPDDEEEVTLREYDEAHLRQAKALAATHTRTHDRDIHIVKITWEYETIHGITQEWPQDESIIAEYRYGKKLY